MRGNTLVALTLVGLVLMYPTSQIASAAGQATTGVILVKFKPGVAASDKADAHRQAG